MHIITRKFDIVFFWPSVPIPVRINGWEVLWVIISKGFANFLYCRTDRINTDKTTRWEGCCDLERREMIRPTKLPTNLSRNRSINKTSNQSTNRTMNESINRSIKQSINRSNNQSINQPANHPINQSINQSINKTTNFIH